MIGTSAVIRETISIVFDSAYRVEGCSPEECLRDPSPLRNADLLVVADDALTTEAACALQPDTPILRLYSRHAGQRARPADGMVITEPFRPAELRAQVEALLAAAPHTQPLQRPTAIVTHPILPHDVVLLARRAGATRFPVLISGEPGTGKTRLARAIHALRAEGRFVALPAVGCTPAALRQAGAIAPGPLTVFVEELEQLSAEGQQLVLELLDCGGYESVAGWHRVRVMCSSTHDFDDLGGLQHLDKELLYRLSVYPIGLPPLRERAEDIPAVVHHLTAGLAPALGMPPATFSARALHRLTHYWWFGNLAELEAVLTRTLVLAGRSTIDAEDLLFGYGRLVPSRTDVGRTGPEAHPAPHDTVDLIINELAHEFKNPMVTIKTIAQHLERLLADDSGREQVARLTGDAVDRMDRALENLLQFTRFHHPAPDEIALSALLAPTLTDLAPTLTERRVLLDYRPPDAAVVFVDAAQIAYAFENLLRVMLRNVPEGQTLSIRPLPTNGLTFTFTGVRSLYTTTLSEFIDHPLSEHETLPLGVVFAKTLIERNGGRFDMGSTTQGLAITVRLPSREDVAPRNGKTTSLSH